MLTVHYVRQNSHVLTAKKPLHEEADMEKKLQGLDWEANECNGHWFREKRNPGWSTPIHPSNYLITLIFVNQNNGFRC